MHYYPDNPGVGYSHCRSGSDSGLHRRGSRLSHRDIADVFDSGDSTLSDLDESESASGSGSGIDIDPNLPYPGIAPLACGYLSQTTRPRSWCLALISNPWFERVSMMVILLNCITLGMYQPCVDKDPCGTTRCRILQTFDEFIFAFFSLEMTIKMIAMGVYGHGSYLADSWNRLDLFIVLAGAVEYGLPSLNSLSLTPVRTIRVLRPLRAINRIPKSVSLIFVHRHVFTVSGSCHSTRSQSRSNLRLPIPRSSLVLKSIHYNAVKMFNHLPNFIKLSPNLKFFEKEVNKILIDKAYYSLEEYYNDKFQP